ncbi:MAG: SDR family oxidoreductase [Verrucomicrobiae bacterium]|nr:SDR family oxidoreductase [Verrucomicrobiae bacterium]
MEDKKLLIIGCGYVGQAVAKFFLEKNWKVTGWIHTENSAEILQSLGVRPYVGDVAKEESWQQFVTHFQPSSFSAALYCAAAGRGEAQIYEQVYRRGMIHAMNYLSEKNFLIFTSSTSVYPQNQGEWVTEQSEANPQTETGNILRATEQQVLTRQGAVLRLAGIYGPNRMRMISNIKQSLQQNQEMPNRWINHIHRDDIVTAIDCLIQKQKRGIFNGCDNEPVPLHQIIAWCADQWQMPIPSWIQLAPEPSTHKRVNNTKMRQLGWQPAYPTYREGYVCLPDN